MKGILTIILALTATDYALSAEDSWARIRQSLEEANTPEAAEAARKYVESLTAEQLIIAGRQCGRELQEAIDSGRPGATEGVMGFAFFSGSYPAAANDLRDIQPILEEIRDKTQPPIWRSELVGILLGRRWNAKLNTGQRQEVFDCLEGVLNDKTDSLCIRNKIPLPTATLLATLYEEHTDAVRSAVPGQRAERENALRRFADRVDTYIDKSLALFADPTMPTTPIPFRQRLLAGAMKMYREGLPGSRRVKDVVLVAFADYRDYPQILWPTLARYAIEDFNAPNANDILNEMIRSASNGKPDSVKNALQGIQVQGERQRERP